MDKVKPLDFSITSVNDSRKAFRTDYIFLIKEFGILYDMSHIIQEVLRTSHSIEFPGPFFFRLNQPYRLREGRIVLLLRGQVTIRYNLIEYTVHPSQILVVPIGSIIEIINIQPNTILRMTGFSPSFTPFARRNEHIEYYWGYKESLIIPLSGSEREIADGYFKLIGIPYRRKSFIAKLFNILLLLFCIILAIYEESFIQLITSE